MIDDFFALVVQMPILKANSKFPPPLKWQKLMPEQHANSLANHRGNIAYRLDEICVIDPDNEAAVSRLSELEANGQLPLTVTSLTWQGRPHRFYRLPSIPIKPLNISRDGIRCELRTGAGQYVLAPPSVVEKNGKSGTYRWMKARGPADIQLATLPAELYYKLAKAAEQHKTKNAQGGPPAPLTEGNRNSRLCSIAGALRRQGLSPSTIKDTLLKVNAEQCHPPLEQAEVTKIATSVGRYAPDSTLTADGAERDLKYARLLARLFKGRLRRAQHRHSWMRYTGQLWRTLDEEEAATLAATELFNLYKAQLDATPVEDKPAIAAITAAIKEVCTRSRIAGALALLAGMPGFATALSEWDSQPSCLNLQNGLLDLTTMTLRPHRPDQLVTKMVNANYDPDATSDAWQAHIQRFLPNHNIRRQVQRQLGTALVGSVLEETLPIWFGRGANGKSTTSRVISHLLGDYAKRAASDLLIEKKHEEHPTKLADLCGSRLVFSIETNRAARLAESLLKELTGGDRLKARFMREDYFEFARTFSIVLIVNHRPVIRGVDHAIWRRISLVPWQQRIPDAEQRPQDEMVDELLCEAPAILNWLLDGLQDWQQDHHWTAPEVLAATEDYRFKSDRLAMFLQACSEIGPNFEVPLAEHYNRYLHWAEEENEKAVSKPYFIDLLDQRGITIEKRGHKKTRTLVGIRTICGAVRPQIPVSAPGDENPRLPETEAARDRTSPSSGPRSDSSEDPPDWVTEGN